MSKAATPVVPTGTVTQLAATGSSRFPLALAGLPFLAGLTVPGMTRTRRAARASTSANRGCIGSDPARPQDGTLEPPFEVAI